MAIACILLSICSPQVIAAPEPAPINTVHELWAGYDPRAESLEIEVAKAWDEEGIRIEQLRFTGETWEGQKVRVFAYRGAPRQGVKLPGILHLHGGGQTASLAWVRYWANRGYVSVSHDFCGPAAGRTTDTVTIWAAAPACMAMPTAPNTNIHPTPLFSAWYHWILVGRRALTLLQQHPQVDPERLGVFGVSVGGTLTWMIAGSDPRVKAAAPIYGIGQNTYTFPWETSTDPAPEDTRRFRALLEPEAYAPFVTCPLLFMSGSNDHHGRLDFGMRTLALTTQSQMLREVYTPLQIHHLDPAEGQDLPLWMDYHLKGVGPAWPGSPVIKITGGDPSPRVSVTVDRPADVAEVRIFYGLNNPWPTSRFYRTLPAGKGAGADFVALAPILNTTDTLYAFANVIYRSGIHLSTRLIKVAASGLPGVRPTLKRNSLIDPMNDQAAWFWWLAGTDPLNQSELLKDWAGPLRERGFTHAQPGGFSFATTALGDPQWKSEGMQALLIDILAEALPQTLDVSVSTTFFQPGQLNYKAHPPMGELRPGGSAQGAPQPGWVTVRLLPGDFKDEQGKPLASWKNVDFLCFSGASAAGKETVFKNLRWEKIE